MKSHQIPRTNHLIDDFILTQCKLIVMASLDVVVIVVLILSLAEFKTFNPMVLNNTNKMQIKTLINLIAQSKLFEKAKTEHVRRLEEQAR